jgi:hypothetical protein
MASIRDLALYMNFTKGCFFDQLINCVKISNTDGIFCFSQAGMTSSNCNGNNSILSKFYIDSSKISGSAAGNSANSTAANSNTNYFFNPIADQFFFKMSLTDLKPLIKCLVGHGLRFYIDSNCDDYGVQTVGDLLKIQRYEIADANNNAKTANSLSAVKRRDIAADQLSKIEYDNYNIIPNFQNINNRVPNVTIPVKKFSSDCSSVASSKPHVVKILGYPNGIVLESKKSDETAACSYTYGYVPEISECLVVNDINLSIDIPDNFYDVNSIGSPAIEDNLSIQIDNPTIDDLVILNVDISAIRMFKKFVQIAYKNASVKIFVYHDTDKKNQFIDFLIPIGPEPGIGYFIVTLRDNTMISN